MSFEIDRIWTAGKIGEWELVVYRFPTPYIICIEISANWKLLVNFLFEVVRRRRIQHFFRYTSLLYTQLKRKKKKLLSSFKVTANNNTIFVTRKVMLLTQKAYYLLLSQLNMSLFSLFLRRTYRQIPAYASDLNN